MSEGTTHHATPDDPNARRVIHAYEDTVMNEGAHASYDKHFAEDCFYLWYGNSPVAGRYEGIGGLKRFWDLLTELCDPDPSPVIELAEKAGIPVLREKLTKYDLYTAEEMFLTGR